MNLFESGDPRPIHFMGIAGAGMSGLALLARHQGAAVTGCDKDPQGAADLAALGVEIWRGHDPGHVSGARAVVVTAAVPREHPELEQAGALGIPVVRRADALGQAVANGTVVGVAGTHGKTTTTAMVTEALAAAGRNPTGLAGGRVATWGGNARVGGRELYVVEADEFDRAFLSLAPTVAVVNNVEADHLECYGGSVAALEQAFVAFARSARRVIAGADDAGAMRVAAAMGETPVWRVGYAADADVRIVEPRLDERGSTARVELPGGRALTLRLRVPGLHNVRNAAAALAVAHELGADLERCLAALAEFGGVGRRFERVGEARGVTVMDDYAHHPTEVQATLAAARQAFPARRVVAVFQPHLFSSAAPGARRRHRRGVARARVVRRPSGAPARGVVPRAPDRAARRAQPRARRRDRGAAIAGRGERLHGHATPGRPRARAAGSNRSTGGAPSARGADGGAQGSRARGARAGTAGRGPAGGGRRRPHAAVRSRAGGARPADRGERGLRRRGGAGADPIGGSGAVWNHHRRARIRARRRAPGNRAPSRAARA